MFHTQDTNCKRTFRWDKRNAGETIYTHLRHCLVWHAHSGTAEGNCSHIKTILLAWPQIGKQVARCRRRILFLHLAPAQQQRFCANRGTAAAAPRPPLHAAAIRKLGLQYTDQLHKQDRIVYYRQERQKRQALTALRWHSLGLKTPALPKYADNPSPAPSTAAPYFSPA
jgi:hypothetical protein